MRATTARLLPWAAVYALAMAYAEAAVVVYLRRLYGIADLIRDVPPYDAATAPVESGRELATLLMLLAVGWAAGRTRQARLGIALFTFGLWDILYYAWLRILIGWPRSVLDLDVLFLVPLPWWGPVLAPVLIALLGVACGTRLVLDDDRGVKARLRPAEWCALVAGNLMVLYAFMADALAALPAGAEELSRLRPAGFAWPAYLAGMAAIAWPAWRILLPRSGAG